MRRKEPARGAVSQPLHARACGDGPRQIGEVSAEAVIAPAFGGVIRGLHHALHEVAAGLPGAGRPEPLLEAQDDLQLLLRTEGGEAFIAWQQPEGRKK